jgi:hypothetical protein
MVKHFYLASQVETVFDSRKIEEGDQAALTGVCWLDDG